ncbi:MAG TPA: hypothetical protein VML75_00265, partial [Kofleriaceae bacterium]|nr:hypothetical protein [Kofleriaceae bacterium]
MTRALGRAFGFILPSLVAAAAGVLASGLIEGAEHTSSVLAAFASTGFVGMLALPTLLVAGVIVRGLYRAWRPAELAAAATEATGGAPRLAAWLAYVLIAAWFAYA